MFHSFPHLRQTESHTRPQSVLILQFSSVFSCFAVRGHRTSIAQGKIKQTEYNCYKLTTLPGQWDSCSHIYSSVQNTPVISLSHTHGLYSTMTLVYIISRFCRHITLIISRNFGLLFHSYITFMIIRKRAFSTFYIITHKGCLVPKYALSRDHIKTFKIGNLYQLFFTNQPDDRFDPDIGTMFEAHIWCLP